jgi:hypothetical protein
MVTILKPFKEVTEVLSGEQYMSLSVAETMIGKLKRCTSSQPDNDILKMLESKLHENLKERFALSEENLLTVLSALLDPRYKRMKYVESEDLKKKAKQDLVRRVQDVVSKCNESSSPPTKRQKLSQGSTHSILDSSSSDDDETPLTSASNSLSALHEVEQYIREIKCDKDVNPLQWWKDHESKFPNVAVVARQIHCIPATSTPSEILLVPKGHL